LENISKKATVKISAHLDFRIFGFLEVKWKIYYSGVIKARNINSSYTISDFKIRYLPGIYGCCWALLLDTIRNLNTYR
jgi:hypothetical protein